MATPEPPPQPTEKPAVQTEAQSSTAKPYRMVWSTRLFVALIAFFGSVNQYTLRSNISFAIVCMVNGSAIEQIAGTLADHKVACGNTGNFSEVKEPSVEGSLVWPKTTQGSVLSAFFWGYTFSQVLGGYLSTVIGGRLVIGGGILASAILTLFNPIAANTSVYLLITLRALIGFCQGAVFPAYHTFFSMWAPPSERSVLLSLAFAGTQIGIVIVMPLSGLLCKYGFAGGWPSIFYVFGIPGIAWSVLWFYLVTDTPRQSRIIDPEERDYIESTLANVMTHDPEEKKRSVPWLSIATSLPVWAIFFGHFAGDWGAYMMMLNLPTYMNDVLGFNLDSMGFLSAIPYIAYFFIINISGFAADKILQLNILRTVNVRRLAMIIALGSQALFLVLSGYCGCGQEALVIAFLTLGIGLSGFQFSGYVVSYLDVAPTYGGILLGIGNTISCLAGVICPLVVGAMTKTGTSGEWRLVFWMTAGILLVGTALYVMFLSGDVQSWAVADTEQTTTQTPMSASPSGNQTTPTPEQQPQDPTAPVAVAPDVAAQPPVLGAPDTGATPAAAPEAPSPAAGDPVTPASVVGAPET